MSLASSSVLFKITVFIALMACCIEYAFAQRKIDVSISLEKYEFRHDSLSQKDSAWLDSLLLRDEFETRMIKAADLSKRRIIDIENKKGIVFFTLYSFCQKYVFHKVSRGNEASLADRSIVMPQTDYLIFIDTDSQSPLRESLTGYFIIQNSIIFISGGVSLPFLERTAEKAAFKTFKEEWDGIPTIGDRWYFPQWTILCRNYELTLLKKEEGELPLKIRSESLFECLGEMSFQK